MSPLGMAIAEHHKLQARRLHPTCI